MDRKYICENNEERIRLLEHLIDRYPNSVDVSGLMPNIELEKDFLEYPVLIVSVNSSGSIYSADLTFEQTWGVDMLTKRLMYNLIGLDVIKPIKSLKKHNAV